MRVEFPSREDINCFFDNYFTSVNVFMHLTEKGICATGTLQENRTENYSFITKSELKNDNCLVILIQFYLSVD